MNRPSFAVLAVAALALSLALPVRAQVPAAAGAAASAAPAWKPDKQFSAVQVISTKDGVAITSKVFVDRGRVRTETNAQGMDIIAILLPEQKKMYSVMPSQKMVMEMPLSGPQAEQMTAATGDADATFEPLGTDTVDGTACTKYKMTLNGDSKVMFWWVNATTKAPVKFADDAGSFTLLWKNYKAGPQDAALFEPPAGYQVMQMPGGMGMPGGGPPGGQ